MITTCDYCKKSFERAQWILNQSKKNIYKGHFCSTKCANTWRNTLRDQQDSYTSFRWFLHCVKARSKSSYKNRRCIKNNLTLEDIKAQWDKQQGICPYTGWKLLLPTNASGWHKEKSIRRASLDRIDSTKDYLLGNIQFVSLISNYAKNQFTEHDLIDFCNAVSIKHPVKANP